MPRVLIVEEAGECLESHVLANLVPSIEQVILIGDHLQLRPQIENYRASRSLLVTVVNPLTSSISELSIDSDSGKLYRLDESLFERLVKCMVPSLSRSRSLTPSLSISAKVPFSVLQTQRRMRPEISSLVR